VRLTVSEAASLLRRDEEQLYAWIEDDALPAQRIAGQYRINRSELLEWATGRGLALAPRIFASRSEGIAPLATALRAGGIRYDVAGDDGATVMSSVIDSLPLRDAADRDTLRHFVLARDAFGLQFIAAGIAVPQVRTPAIVAEVAAVTLAFPGKPIALQSRVAGAIFFVVAPTVHGHLMMLSQLTACLGDHEFVDAVVRRLPENEIFAAAAAVEERL